MNSVNKIPDKIASVSEFSQGKAGKIFNDVNNNHIDYIVMKNNNPVAIILPVEEYNSYRDKITFLESMLAKYMTNSSSKRFGVAKGEFEVPDDFDEWDVGFGDIDNEDLT